MQLARKYGIVTPYTSYLIVEDEIARDVPVARQSMGRRRGLSLLPSGEAAAPTAPGADFGLDTEALHRADEDAFAHLAEGETGDGAVAAARASAELKEAKTAGATRAAFRETQYAAKAGSKLKAQETRLIAGKSFYQNGAEWIDSEAQGLVDAEVTEIEFGSDRYFELLGKSTQIAQWLSVANALQLVIDGKLYKIVPAA